MTKKPQSPNRTPHKHAEVIKAWADGQHVQYRYGDGDWRDFDDWPDTTAYGCAMEKYQLPLGSCIYQWRIKPPQKTPGQVAQEGYKSENWATQKMPHELWEASAKAVIEAYKRGEFDDA